MEKEIKEEKSRKSSKEEKEVTKKKSTEEKIEKDLKDDKSQSSKEEKEEILLGDSKEVSTEKKKGKAKKIIIIIIILLAIIIFIWWWFNRKFNFTFKYNNGLENYTVKVKFLDKVKDEDIKRNIGLVNHTFIDFFETYYLDGKSIEKIKENPELESSICKKDFKLNDDKNKCIAIIPYDFKKKRVTKDTTVEAFWSSITFIINPSSKEIYVGDSFDISVTLSGTNDTKVSWSVEDGGIASVSESGHVVGLKVGKTKVIVESNGIKKYCEVNVLSKDQPKQEVKKDTKEEQPVKKDEGTIKLSSNNQCLIGSDSLNIMANVNNTLDDTINWNSLKCFDINKISGNQVSLTRLGNCGSLEELNPTITASLNNGASDSLNINYESRLGITVYDGNKEIQKNSEGVYKGNNIRVVANQNANFTAVNPWNANQSRIFNVTNNTVHLDGQCDATVVVKTNCGQSITLNVEAEIN